MWWMWTKRVFFIVASALLIFGAFRRLYYFHDEMIYGDPKLLDPSYSSQIQVETYLMSLPNLIDLFEGKPPNPDMSSFTKKFQWSDFEQPACPRFYLVVCLKNKGDKIAWGVLDYAVDGEKTRQVEVPPLPPRMSKFEIIALKASQRDKNQHSDNPEYPEIQSTWVQLFTETERIK